MSASLRSTIAVVAAGLSCLVIGNAWAQRETEREIEREGTSAQSADTDADREGTGQTTQQRREYTAQFRGAQATAGNQEEQVERFLAECLLAKNEAEVEFGQFAQQQAQNPQVKEFAQRMVQDHRKLIQQLQPLAGGQAATERSASTSITTTSQVDAQRQASETTRLPGSPGAGQATPGATSATQSLTATDRPANQQNDALNRLAQIERQITERHAQTLREELQQKRGAEFDQAFVGSQIAEHMHMLAALEVIAQQGPERLQQIAQQAQPTVEQHLQHAKQLKQQLMGQAGRASTQAERQPARTQR
ncbi:MAG: DUF4142 domain-containing protein [Pirellulales bacterium]